jgi:hypothetical protein
MKIKQFTFRTRVRHTDNLTYCYILDRAKIAKKFESFNIIPEQEVQSDYKKNGPEVKAESSKTKILETEKKNLTKKKETSEGKLSVQTLPAKKISPSVSPKPNHLKVKVMPAELAKTAKIVSAQSGLRTIILDLVCIEWGKF